MKSQLELEVQHYWRVMQAPVERLSTAAFRDELEVLEIVTDSEALRRACALALDNRYPFFARHAGKISA